MYIVNSCYFALPLTRCGYWRCSVFTCSHAVNRGYGLHTMYYTHTMRQRRDFKLIRYLGFSVMSITRSYGVYVLKMRIRHGKNERHTKVIPLFVAAYPFQSHTRVCNSSPGLGMAWLIGARVYRCSQTQLLAFIHTILYITDHNEMRIGVIYSRTIISYVFCCWPP